MSLKHTVRRLISLWSLAHNDLATAIDAGNLPLCYEIAEAIDEIELNLLLCGVNATPRHDSVRGVA